MDERSLREAVCQANRDLAESGLVVLAFGNASAVDRAAGVMAIKPSGAIYGDLQPADMVLVTLADGEGLGPARPSSDAPTHRRLYQAFEGIGGVIHTHSPYATAWAQAGRPIPCLGTTHADHFHGPVPVTRELLAEEIAADYEANTGAVVVERFRGDGLDPLAVPGCLVAGHGPFVWGTTVAEALANAVALEHIAAIATHQLALGPATELAPALLERHFSRKHGPSAYYGQPVREPA
jgi:L-ribulose-5-phosphate 4-epimerase